MGKRFSLSSSFSCDAAAGSLVSRCPCLLGSTTGLTSDLVRGLCAGEGSWSLHPLFIQLLISFGLGGP